MGRGQPLPGDSSEALDVPPLLSRRMKAKSRGLSGASGMGSSLAIHAAALGLIALITLPKVDKAVELWISSTAAPTETATLDDTAPSDVAADDEPNEALDQLIDPGGAPLGELTSLVEIDGAAGESAIEGLAVGPGMAVSDFPGDGPPVGGSLGDSGSIFGSGGHGLARLGDGVGAAPAAKFFGAKIEGRRIVFVLDNSGSMQGGRLETVIEELLRCVESLTEKQEFFVLFYSDQVYPLFYPVAASDYVRPTAETKIRLAAWLETVELCLGDTVIDAMNAAVELSPDAVFLISDGRIAGNAKMQRLLTGGGGFPIHTIAVGLGAAPVGRKNLESIATTHGGKFHDAEVSKQLRDLAREKPRQYHRDAPGEVWGRSVRGGGWARK